MGNPNKTICKFAFWIWKKWENDFKSYYLIMDLHKLLVSSNHDYEDQMSIILLHIYLGAISCLIINVYIEFFYKYAYYKHSMNLYHPIDPKCFKKLDHTSSYFVELLCIVNLQVAWFFTNNFNNLWVKAKLVVNPLPPFFLCFISLW
jgi:hypothetical protein